MAERTYGRTPTYQDNLRSKTENFRDPSPMYPGRPEKDVFGEMVEGFLEKLRRAQGQVDPMDAVGQAPDTGGLLLRMGEELQEPSEEERALQQALVSAGAQIEVDGYAGPKTIAALNQVLQGMGVSEEFSEGSLIPASILALLGL